MADIITNVVQPVIDITERKKQYIAELAKTIKQVDDFLEANPNFQHDMKFMNTYHTLKDTYESLTD